MEKMQARILKIAGWGYLSGFGWYNLGLNEALYSVEYHSLEGAWEIFDRKYTARIYA